MFLNKRIMSPLYLLSKNISPEMYDIQIDRNFYLMAAQCPVNSEFSFKQNYLYISRGLTAL